MFWCWWFCVGACGGVVVLVFLWWCSCGGILVVVILWWCLCGGVCVVVFAWWCLCGGVCVVFFFVVVFLWWCLNQANTLFESSEQRFNQSRLSQTIL